MVGCPLAMTDGCARGKVDRIRALKEQILINPISNGTSWNSINEGAYLQASDEVGNTSQCNNCILKRAQSRSPSSIYCRTVHD